jgi:hypoxia up-regulated 1
MLYAVFGGHCVQAPLTKLLARNKLTAKDVDAVELLGGGSRVPKLQAELSAALGGRCVGMLL